MIVRLFSPLEAVFQRWAENRRPRGRSVFLNQKRIFIFPTAAGWGYLLLCLILFLIGINYQNNLIHALAFFLIAVGVITIHITFLNLSGLKVSAVGVENCFKGENLVFTLQLERENSRQYESIEVSLPGETPVVACLNTESSTTVQMYVAAVKRGRQSLPAIKIATVYPLGLLQAWSWLDLQQQALVYPRPIKGAAPQTDQGGEEGEGLSTVNGGDDFAGLDDYQPGMSTRHIAWKQFAQGRGVLSKTYAGRRDNRVWLDWNDWPQLGAEHRLSVICYWLLHYERNHETYGLRLPGSSTKPDNGPAHQQKLLALLACYGEEQ